MGTHQLFAYGTLLEGRVQRAVIGREVSGEPARLDGFRKTKLQEGNDVFPNLVPDAATCVTGRVLTIDDAELSNVDRYEGDLYARHRVTLSDGREVWTYYA
jgi:gamma-glutamylcyclotransferase (GGCT)/AIG2-like uncharacterized protein YtfP